MILDLQNTITVMEVEKDVLETSNGSLRNENAVNLREKQFMNAELFRKDNTINNLCHKITKLEDQLNERNEIVQYNKILLTRPGVYKN